VVDVNCKRVFILEAPGVKAYERTLSFGELLHLVAVNQGLTVDQLDLSPRENELVSCVIEHRDRARPAKKRADSQPLIRAAFALADADVRSGDQLDALMAHLTTTVREYREGGGA
jgi:hypothetical protein